MIVINGEKYNSICKVFTSKTKAQYDGNITSYGHTICVKSPYIITLVQANPLNSPSSQTCVTVCEGRISDNLAFYDEENRKELTQADMREIYAWLDSSSPNWWLSQAQLSIDYLKSGTLATEKELNTRNEFATYGGGFFNTSNFNYYNYVDSQYSPLFDNVYIGFLPTLSNGARARLEYDIVSGVDVVASYNDLKISQSIWYNSCVLAQKLNGKIDNTVFSVDWTIYIDGTYNPNIKITWDSEYMNFDEIGNTFDASKTFIGYGSEIPFNVDWESGSFTTSYKEVVKVLYPSIYEKIIEGVGSLLDAPSFSIRLLGATLNGGVQVNSGTCFFVMSSKGTVSESGLAEGSEGLSDTITIIYGNDTTGGEDEESDEPIESDNPSEGSEISVKGFNLLTLTYALTPNRLAQLGSFIWGASFLTNLKLVNNNPIENIVSCKMFPFTVGGSANTSIKLGNVDTGINGNPISSGGYSAKKVINGFTIAPLFNNFLDYEPYTKISVFLPFIGIKELQPSQIMNKVLSLEYVVDIVTGICKCIVKSGGKQIADYDGSIGIDIPITSSNRAQVELSYITSALGVVGSIAMGSPLGVVGSVLSGASSSYHSETKGTSSPTTGVYGALTPFVIFDRPKYTLPSAYGRTKGFVCNKTCTIGSLSGFTVCHENVKLNGISCTNEELEEIKSLLTSGFFA